MASSHGAWRRPSGLLWLGRALAATGVIAGLSALPALAGTAAAAHAASAAHTAAAGKGRVAAAKPAPLRLAIDSVSPTYATPGRMIVIKGKVKNGTSHAIDGLKLELLASTTPLATSTALTQFAAGAVFVPQNPVNVKLPSLGHLSGAGAKPFVIRLPASDLRLDCFGVYPITVEVGDPTGAVTASDPVPLPFWPSKTTTCSHASRPDPFAISWVWPLIDVPHQGACPGLLGNSLARSLAPGGRLANLLAVGASYSTKAALTWAIDPALLDNAATMAKPHLVGSSAKCQKTSSEPADRDASTWLKNVVHATTGQPVFVTPYADVDLAGLAQYGDNADLRTSFGSGERLAAPVLRRSPTPAPVPAGPNQLSALAWPADGLASAAVLQNLGAMKIGTVILAMPPSPQLTYTPGAVTSMADGVGSTLKVLLADDSLTSLLSSRKTASRQAGTVFDVSQLFLAETAMIVAEAPAMQRPIMVTPPRRWNPGQALATRLLGDTASAPWLRPSTVGELTALPQEHSFRSLVRPHPKPELPGKLLKRVAKLDRRAALLKSIMLNKDDQLSHAVYGIESSAWAGARAEHAQRMLNRTTAFVTSQFAQINVGGQRVVHVTLGGRVGSVTVAIHNSLSYPVKVGLQVKSSNRTVTAKQRRAHEVYIVSAHSSTGLKLSVNATQTGKATLKLSLRAPNGVLLPDPPDKPLIMRISATNLGTVALVIFAAALAVFVVASAAQAIRRGRPGTDQPPPPADEPSGPDAGSDGATPESGPSTEVSSPDEAVSDQALGPEQPDKFDSDHKLDTYQSELSSVGQVQVTADQRSPLAGDRPTDSSATEES